MPPARGRCGPRARASAGDPAPSTSTCSGSTASPSTRPTSPCRTPACGSDASCVVPLRDVAPDLVDDEAIAASRGDGRARVARHPLRRRRCRRGVMRVDVAAWTERSARVAVEDLDLDAAFREQPLDAAALRCLRYMHDVEHHTVCYLRDLLVTPAHRDAEITAFLTMWVVRGVLARRGDQPRARCARRGRRCAACPAAAHDARVARPADAVHPHRRRRARGRVVARRAHDVGRGQRVDHAGGLRAAQRPCRPSGAHRAARADHEAGGPAHRLLRVAGRATPRSTIAERRSSTRARAAPVLEARRRERDAGSRGRAPRALPLRRRVPVAPSRSGSIVGSTGCPASPVCTCSSRRSTARTL